MTAKDTTKYAAALQQVVTACQIAERSGYITPTTAIKIIDSIAGRLGVDIDAKAEFDAISKMKPVKGDGPEGEDDVFQTDEE